MKQSAPRGINFRADNVFERPARLAVAAQRAAPSATAPI
ncbi:hypothetical protein LTSEMIS_3572, partial [Salmonella enterica subsp. enterica serovar Mississippi str. A4-633]